MNSKLPGDTLTVVFRNDAPLFCANDCSSYRSVQIKLTDEQRAALALRFAWSTGGKDFHEEISRCFIEPEREQSC